MMTRQEALSARNEATGACLRALKQLTQVARWPDGKQRWAEIIADWNGWDDADKIDDAMLQIDAAIEALQAYDKAHQDFLDTLVKE